MAEDQQAKEVKNKVKISKAGPCRKKIAIEIPRQTIESAFDEQYGTLGKDSEVPGFRKGRAPRRLLERRFGKDVNEQVKVKLLSDASDSAVKDNELKILRDPNIDHEKIELPDEGPMKFDFEVEVRPEFKLPELEGIKVTKTKLEITDDQVEREIDQMRRYTGLWTPRQDQPIEAEDQIIADAILNIEGVEEEEKLDNTEIYVRPSGFVGSIPVEKLDELLVGAKTGDVKKTTIKVPDTYFREQYRGKKVDIQIDIKEVKWLKPADINEAFLSRMGVDDADGLKERIRDSLTGRLEQQVRTEMAEQIYKYMLDNIDFDLPTDIVADQADTILKRQFSSLLQRSLPPEQIEQRMKELQAASAEQAKEQLKTYFIMDSIAEKLGVEVTDEEINGHIAQLAIQRSQRPQQVREQMTRDGSLIQFGLEVRNQKCIDKLLESAKIVEVKAAKKAEKVKKTTEKVKKTAKKAGKKTVKTADSDKKSAKKTKKTSKKETDK